MYNIHQIYSKKFENYYSKARHHVGILLGYRKLPKEEGKDKTEIILALEVIRGTYCIRRYHAVDNTYHPSNGRYIFDVSDEYNESKMSKEKLVIHPKTAKAARIYEQAYQYLQDHPFTPIMQVPLNYETED